MKNNQIEKNKADRIIKLNMPEYIFRYKKDELCNAKLKYNFAKIKSTIYDNGKKIKETTNDLIEFSIYADDKNSQTYRLDLILKLSLEDLNNLTNEPHNINNYIKAGEIYFEDPYEEEIFQIYCSFEEKMYYDTPNFYAAKIEENKFSFKISIPEECIFIWFNTKIE